MSQADDCTDMLEKGFTVALTAVLVVLVRDRGWTKDEAQALLNDAMKETIKVGAWLKERLEQ